MYSNRVYRFILKQLKDSSEAKDIVQNTFEKVWNKRESIKFETSKQYIFTVAYRDMLNLIKKNSKVMLLEQLPETSKTDSRSYSDLNEILDRALSTLPPIQRTVVLLRDYEGYSYDEIGDITDLKESQVKVYIHRARKSLKNYLISIEYIL